jgi:Protein of unknown function (DUF3465)
MKKWLLVIVIAIVYAAYHYGESSVAPAGQVIQETAVHETVATGGTQAIRQAFDSQSSNLQVEASGAVLKLLADDEKVPRHQRFIVKLDNGMTLLIVHNIDLAERVADLAVGDVVSFNGEYIWNQKGGLVHWTHHDPQGRHVAGWLRHNGRTYQ